MHSEAYDYVARTVHGRRFGRVIEVGSRNWNGTVRDLVDCDEYVGVDGCPGVGVDVVADAFEWVPPWTPNLIICCEVLEHVRSPWYLVARMLGWLEVGGELVVTAATDPRPEHAGGTDYYGNVSLDDLIHSQGDVRRLEVHRDRGDIYAQIVRV